MRATRTLGQPHQARRQPLRGALVDPFAAHFEPPDVGIEPPGPSLSARRMRLQNLRTARQGGVDYARLMPGDAVKISAGITGGVLAPVSLLVAAAATVAFAFTPTMLAGAGYVLGYAFAIGGGVALMGVSMSIVSLRDGRGASKGTPRRAAPSASESLESCCASPRS